MNKCKNCEHDKKYHSKEGCVKGWETYRMQISVRGCECKQFITLKVTSK